MKKNNLWLNCSVRQWLHFPKWMFKGNKHKVCRKQKWGYLFYQIYHWKFVMFYWYELNIQMDQSQLLYLVLFSWSILIFSEKSSFWGIIETYIFGNCFRKRSICMKIPEIKNLIEGKTNLHKNWQWKKFLMI